VGVILLGASAVLAPRAGLLRFALVAYPLAIAGWLLLRRATLPFPAVIAVALSLRALLLFPTPALSNDVYRYLRDGRVSARGINPYAEPPNDPRINHPEIPSIYPPHAQMLFVLAHDLVPWRLLVCAFDVLAICLLRRHGLALAYATFPPLLFEGVWSGHIDAIAATFVLLAILYRSGIALGFATGMKVIPAAAFPALARSPRFILGFALTLVLPALPFIGKPFMPGFRQYATRWIFNSPLYDLVFAVVERIPTKELWSHHPLRVQAISDVVYRHVYPDFVTRVTLLILACGLIALAGRSVARAIAALLICSPAIHPWYWLALAPAAMLEKSAWLWVALCAPFSYLLYADVPRGVVYALCYALPLVTLLRPSARASSGAESRFAALRFRRARDTSPT
jgi:hypothetical protein